MFLDKNDDQQETIELDQTLEFNPKVNISKKEIQKLPDFARSQIIKQVKNDILNNEKSIKNARRKRFLSVIAIFLISITLIATLIYLFAGVVFDLV
ncbi:hypothetical protein MCFN_02180 [Mycoplasmopsis californica]|uniref:Uncharacterized protein n=1 Tax=Mycoplasmopsis californica TaxID=2113 RepID=A0A059XM19_9BACT|nr:hypothetical protein [Mycoplasmopsis californica]AIA29574.1 hypothetical protein MCFN_02180 [Mycoplasmopsis californica]